MSFNLVETTKNLITSQLVSKASSLLGENEAGTQKLINGTIPVTIASLLHQVNTSNDNGASVVNMAKQAVNSGVLNHLGDLFNGDSSNVPGVIGIVSQLFGNKLNSVINGLASFAGVKTSSASSILGMVMPTVLALFGKHVTQNNLSTADATSLLSENKTSLLSAVPSGLNLTNILGLGSLSSLGIHTDHSHETKTTTHTYSPENRSSKKSGGMGWLWLLLGLLLVVALLWYFLRGCNTSTGVVTQKDTTTFVSSDAPKTTVPIWEPIKVKLPNGIELDAYKGGIEDLLVTYLNSTKPEDSLNHNLWFNFDNINFKTGTADLTDSSMVQMKNVQAILNAYPKSKIKIGGYTDKTGDSLANIKLSQSRADAIVNILKKDGAKAEQIAGAEGYGSQFATMPATATDEERKVDRKMALNVREK